MEKIGSITKKLILIESAWRDYFFTSNFLLSKIDYDKIINSNYVGVIIGYLDDSLPFLKTQETRDKNSAIFYSIGLLQTIYVQQDLVKELFGVFDLKIKIERLEIRKLRNILIGHPISRDNENQDLKSFTLFAYTTNSSTLSYLKYSKKNDFKFESVSYNFKDILDKHFQFLDFRFGKILDKIKEIFNEYLEILENMLLEIDELEFESLITDIEKYSNAFFNEGLVFKKDNILRCYELKNSHPRYEYNITYFIDSLKCYLKGKINAINECFLNKKANYEDENIIFNRIDLMDKLYENHPVFGIDYFKNVYKDDKKAIIELENMQKNINNELEYYSSYNYLNYLLSNKN